MREQQFHQSGSHISRLEVGTLVALLVIALFFAHTPNSTAQVPQDNRQLQREQTNVAQQRRIALVIGNGAYQTVKALKNPPNDATLLAATLRKLGFEVTVATDKSQREMKRLIREFGQRLREGGGVGLFYFAGHGVQARGHNYLIPVDADIQTEADLEDVGVDVNYVLNMMDDAQNALNIAILDACRNNPFARSFRSTQEGLAQVKAPTGTLIAYATSPDSVAADGGGTNSPYTEELTRQIQASDVLLETMFRRVTEQVSFRTGGRQEPWYSANVKGDFYFSKSPSSSLSNTPAKIDAVAVEREYWETIRSNNEAQDYKDYLRVYPKGTYADVARAKIKQFETARRNQPVDSQLLSSEPSNSIANSKKVSTRASPTYFKNQQGIEMVYIPPGSFMMGMSDLDMQRVYKEATRHGVSLQELRPETPKHEVTFSSGFYMGQYEVTQAQWQAVMGNNPSHFKACGSNCPVEKVSWHDAQDFIIKLNETNDGFKYRLPSEAEWEYACRAGTTGDHYSADVRAIGWYLDNLGNKTHVVGGKQPNAFGLYDMSGNVWEWCGDWYHENYNGAPADGSVWLSGGEQKYRVMRGGSWINQAIDVRSAHRAPRSPLDGDDVIGFRVVGVARTQ